MKGTSQQHRTQKDAHCKKLCVTVFVSVLAMVAGSGCEEEMAATQQGAVSVPKPAEVNDIRAQAVQIVQDSLSDANPMLRVNAIEVVAETGQARQMPKVQRLLNDPIVPVRFAGTLAIGDTEYSLAESSVQQLLRDANPNVRTAASYAMAKLGHAEYSEVLLKALTSKDQTVRANAALLLGKAGNRAAVKQLYWALTDKASDDKVVYQAAESIARLGDEWIYPKLWAMLISAYADVRVIGIRAMGELGTRDAKSALVTMLEDQIPQVRLAAAGQLGRLGDQAGEKQVLDALGPDATVKADEREREQVNVLAALAIGQIGTPALAEHLPQLLADQSKFVRLAAAKSVLMRRGNKAQPGGPGR